VAALALAYLACALLVAGLPPLAGFLSKAALLTAIWNPGVGGTATGASTPVAAWLMMALILCSSLCATISLARAGIRHFWSKGGRFAPRLSIVEGGAVMVLIVAGLLLTVFAEPVLRYTRATATHLHAPQAYIDAVLSARPRPGPTAPALERADPP
jgi:multicomponent K+:H+ antiporter subunit D